MAAMVHAGSGRRRDFLALARGIGLALWATTMVLPAADQPSVTPAGATFAYRLTVRDQIEVTVFEEAELSASQRIDADGQIRLGLIGTVMIAGKTTREAEDLIEKQFVEQRFLRQPMVTVRILDYAAREAMVNGAVMSSGPFTFPAEIPTVDIVEVITKRGGFKSTARDNAVRVTRFSDKGRETFVVPVRDMLLGRNQTHFPVLPGDVIYVDD